MTDEDFRQTTCTSLGRIEQKVDSLHETLTLQNSRVEYLERTHVSRGSLFATTTIVATLIGGLFSDAFAHLFNLNK